MLVKTYLIITYYSTEIAEQQQKSNMTLCSGLGLKSVKSCVQVTCGDAQAPC